MMSLLTLILFFSSETIISATEIKGLYVFPADSVLSTPEDDFVETVQETVCSSEYINSLSQTDSFEAQSPNLRYPALETNPYKFHITEIIAPAALITVGSFGLSRWWKIHVNNQIKKGLQNHPHHKLSFDNYLQLMPAVAGYGMNLFGFDGLHNVADVTIIYATAYILTEASVLSLKHIIHSERPNKKNNMSFPSGHTANAFAGAELLRREYWHKSPWIGVAGYLVATTTAFMRLYNNAHWLNDVIAGAGIGILCAEAAYWLYPVITKTFFKNRFNANVFLSPTISTNNLGLACYISL